MLHGIIYFVAKLTRASRNTLLRTYEKKSPWKNYKNYKLCHFGGSSVNINCRQN